MGMSFLVEGYSGSSSSSGDCVVSPSFLPELAFSRSPFSEACSEELSRSRAAGGWVETVFSRSRLGLSASMTAEGR